jgi:hypothetical protein
MCVLADTNTINRPRLIITSITISPIIITDTIILWCYYVPPRWRFPGCRSGSSTADARERRPPPPPLGAQAPRFSCSCSQCKLSICFNPKKHTGSVSDRSTVGHWPASSGIWPLDGYQVDSPDSQDVVDTRGHDDRRWNLRRSHGAHASQLLPSCCQDFYPSGKIRPRAESFLIDLHAWYTVRVQPRQ